MSEKTPTSVNLRDAHIDRMDQRGLNRSELVNRLLDEYFDGGEAVSAAVEQYHIRQLKAQEEAAKAQFEAAREQRRKAEESVTTAEDKAEERFAEVAAEMDGIPADPSNPAVQTQAEKLDMDAGAFADRLRTWRADDA